MQKNLKSARRRCSKPRTVVRCNNIYKSNYTVPTVMVHGQSSVQSRATVFNACYTVWHVSSRVLCKRLSQMLRQKLGRSNPAKVMSMQPDSTPLNSSIVTSLRRRWTEQWRSEDDYRLKWCGPEEIEWTIRGFSCMAASTAAPTTAKIEKRPNVAVGRLDGRSEGAAAA